MKQKWEKEKENMKLSGQESEENLREVRGRENMIKIFIWEKIFEEKCRELNSWYFEKVNTLDKLQSSELKRRGSSKFKLEMEREIL